MKGAETTAPLPPPIRILLSILGLAIVAGAVLMNFRLLAAAMTEMFVGRNYIGSFKLAEITALAIVLVELSMGLYLMEAWGVTNLWLRRTLPEEMCSRLFWITLIIIGSLALAGAGLIHLENVVLAEGSALGMEGSAVFLPVPQWLRMGLAFGLPFVIAIWAIPFEALLRVFRAPRV